MSDSERGQGNDADDEKLRGVSCERRRDWKGTHEGLTVMAMILRLSRIV